MIEELLTRRSKALDELAQANLDIGYIFSEKGRIAHRKSVSLIKEIKVIDEQLESLGVTTEKLTIPTSTYGL